MIKRLRRRVGKNDEWLELVGKARLCLRPETYREWMFAVGSTGSISERIELGREAFERLRPKQSGYERIGPSEHKRDE